MPRKASTYHLRNRSIPPRDKSPVRLISPGPVNIQCRTDWAKLRRHSSGEPNMLARTLLFYAQDHGFGYDPVTDCLEKIGDNHFSHLSLDSEWGRGARMHHFHSANLTDARNSVWLVAGDHIIRCPRTGEATIFTNFEEAKKAFIDSLL
jgi:hypothetical protein